MTHLPPVRAALVILGCLLIAAAPIVGPIPGPGGIIVFAAGLSLVLKYSGWAKRLYVRFKRRHPKKGAWADWGLRRASARRRHEIARSREASEAGAADRGRGRASARGRHEIARSREASEAGAAD